MIYKYRTNIPGLKYRPSFNTTDPDTSFIPNALNKDLLDSFCEFNDYIEKLDLHEYRIHHGSSWTDANTWVLENLCHELHKNYNTINIMEIGVARDQPSSTTTLTANASNYFGIDLRDTSHIQTKPHVKTLQISSLEQTKVREFVNKPIHLLFIDGDHSINTVLNDWQYQDLVVKGGYIVMHDTNHHPGPHSVFEAINEWDYVKSRTCLSDYGLGLIRKKI